LQNQVWSPFKERVKLCAQSVLKANQETGRNCLYCPCLNGPSDEVLPRAHFAKQCGAGAIMVLPGIVGWDVIRVLSSDEKFGLPILIHPAMLGGWLQQSFCCYVSTSSRDTDDYPQGLSHNFLLGMLPRLCGGDAIIFCNSGGRFQFTDKQCQQICYGCRRPLGRFEAIVPTPAGGMKLDNIHKMRKRFGDDTMFLIGGNLLEQGSDLEMNAKLFARCAGRNVSVTTLSRRKRTYESLAVPATNETRRGSQGVGERGTNIDTEGVERILPSINDVESIARTVLQRVLECTIKNDGGYLSQACSSSRILATLYLRALNLGPSVAPLIPKSYHPSMPTGEGYNGDPRALNFDRLIFSPAHYAIVLYSLLVEIGRLDEKAFDSYNVDGSTVELIGAEHSPGHAVTAGSLAQALSQGAGIAFARKKKHATGRVAVFMSDGEFQEGQTWEAVQMMVNYEINLVAVVDVNGQQCDGKMEEVFAIGDLAKKLRAFGADVSVVDGHDVSEIEMAVKKQSLLPRFVLCITDPCWEINLIKNRAPKLHYIRFKDSKEKNQFQNVLIEMKKSQIEESVAAKMKIRTIENIIAIESVEKVHETSIQHSRGELCEVLDDIKIVTRPHRTHLLEWMKSRPKAVVVTADLTSSCEADLIKDTLPKQYISAGMAEQNLISFCGGLAREGFLPLVHSFGVFMTRRPFDQLAMSVAAPNLKVILLGFLPGIISPGGITHQAIDDISLCKACPNLRVLEVSDATEVESVLDVAEQIDGPVYIRMLRGAVSRLYPTSFPMKFGEARLLSEGCDVLVITSGICTEDAIRARRAINSSVSIKHLHLSTIVPFPRYAVLDAATAVKFGVITLENHSILGGIGSSTAEVLAENGVGKKLIRLGLPGCYIHGASRQYLQTEFSMDVNALIEAIRKLCHKHLVVAFDRMEVDKNTECEERVEDL
jgi:transketolase